MIEKKGHGKGFPVMAVVMIAVGVAFIFNFLPGYESLFGPIITLGFGVGLLIKYVTSDKGERKPPFIAVILTTVAAILLISDLWPALDLGSLFMLVIGIMLLVRYGIDKSERTRFPMTGVVLAVLGILLLLRTTRLYWVLPVLLMAGGILMIGNWHLLKRKSRGSESD